MNRSANAQCMLVCIGTVCGFDPHSKQFAFSSFWQLSKGGVEFHLLISNPRKTKSGG